MTRYFLTAFAVLLFCFLSGCAAVESTQQYVEEKVSALKDDLTSMQAESKADEAYHNADFKTAFTGYLEAAGNGSPDAQFMAGSMLIQGEGTAENLTSGFNWITKAADQGYPPALYSLGILRLEGVGTKQDLNGAAQCFKTAAEKEHVPSMYVLGVLYTQGAGVNKNNSEAIRWFRLAKANGFPVENVLLEDPDYFQVQVDGWWLGQRISTKGISAQQQLQKVQERLTTFGYAPGPADGLMGKRTASAIRSFQKDLGLDATGEVDQELLTALNSF